MVIGPIKARWLNLLNSDLLAVGSHLVRQVVRRRLDIYFTSLVAASANLAWKQSCLALAKIFKELDVYSHEAPSSLKTLKNESYSNISLYLVLL
jgi:hypothetical protein